MGGLPCCRHTEQKDYILKEEYKSILDEKIAVFEEENSGLKLLDIDMFLEYITNISEDTIDHTNFSLFVSQKIIENPLFSKEFMGEENFQKVQKVKDFMDILFNRLIRCYFKYRSLRKYQEIEFALDKIFLFVIGLLFFKASYKKKIELVFNIFSQNGVLVKNDSRLRDFIYLLFAINSIVYFKSLNEFYEKENKPFGDEFKESINYSEEKIMERTDLFMEEFFEANEKLNFIEYEMKFHQEDSNGLWILYGPGVRSNLEKVASKSA